MHNKSNYQKFIASVTGYNLVPHHQNMNFKPILHDKDGKQTKYLPKNFP